MFDYNYMMVKMSTFHLRIFLLHNNLGSLLFFLFFVCFCCLEDFSQMVFKMNAEIYARIWTFSRVFFLCILKEPILIWPTDLTEIIKTCFMLGCYTAIFNITAETSGQKSTGKVFPKKINLWFSCAQIVESLKKKSRLIMRAFQEKLITFSVKNNNFPLMNPLLAAIDLQEALPRVIHDPDKKIHCRIQTERTAFLLYRVWLAIIENQSFSMTKDLMLSRDSVVTWWEEKTSDVQS